MKSFSFQAREGAMHGYYSVLSARREISISPLKGFPCVIRVGARAFLGSGVKLHPTYTSCCFHD